MSEIKTLMEHPNKNKFNCNRNKAVQYRIDEDGCWICTSHALGSNGYPKIVINGRYNTVARIVYEKIHGNILTGLHVLHRCDNPACINPRHLFLGTHKDNMRDMIKKGRHRGSGKTKLTEVQVREILQDQLSLTPSSQLELAKKYQVGRGTISAIKTGIRRCQIYREFKKRDVLQGKIENFKTGEKQNEKNNTRNCLNDSSDSYTQSNKCSSRV